MKYPSLLTVLLVLLFSCSEKKEQLDSSEEIFTSEMMELKEYFKIPGLAVSIDKNGENIYRRYFGESDRERSTKLDSAALFPIASLTKVFSGVLIMKLVEQGKLSLDEPMDTFLKEPILGDSILVKHVLSHTSQGNVGKNFLYSSRFRLITNVIEKASGKSFSEMIEKEILDPLELKNTFLLRDSTQIERVAKPYLLDNGIEIGFVDYGYSASAGIVSNLADLAIFNEALDNNSLMKKTSKETIFSAFNRGLPYGYGIFNQQLDKVNLVWAYGQYDCYSSLLLKIPSENTTLTLLANSSLLSDPARLINGDVSSSLFALSFLKNYVYEFSEMSLLEKQDSLAKPVSKTEFYRNKIQAQALAESYMARFEPEKMKTSQELLSHLFSEYPNYLDYADINLLHTLSFLKDVAYYRELGDFNDFDAHIITIGNQLFEQDPTNPYVNSYLGTYHSRKGNKQKAKYHFESIVRAKNFSRNWYTREAQQWLNENQ